jgi:hypothetical protein
MRRQTFLAGSAFAVAIMIAMYVLGPAIVLIVKNLTAGADIAGSRVPMIQIGPEIWVAPGFLVVFSFAVGALHVVGPTALGLSLLQGGYAATLVGVVLALLAYRTLLRYRPTA